MRKRIGVNSEKAKVYVETWVQVFNCLRYFLVFMFGQFFLLCSGIGTGQNHPLCG